MHVTEVRLAPTPPVTEAGTRLKAACAITFDASFVVHDVKVVESVRPGEDVFCAMPSRKAQDRCPGCRGKNPVQAKFCSWCGTRLGAWEGRARRDEDGRLVLHHDVCHPLVPALRKEVNHAVLAAYGRWRDGEGLAYRVAGAEIVPADPPVLLFSGQVAGTPAGFGEGVYP